MVKLKDRGSSEQVMGLDKLDEDMQKRILAKSFPPHQWSCQRISKWLKDDFGITDGSSHVSVGKWLERKQGSVTSSIYGSEAFKTQTAKAYGEVVENYYDGLKRMSNLLRQLLADKQIDKLQKAKAASDLFAVIREGTVSAKDMLVGTGGAENKHLDMEKEMDKLQDDFPQLTIVPSRR